MITNIDFLVKIDNFVYIQSNLCALIFHQKYHKLKNRLHVYQQLWTSKYLISQINITVGEIRPSLAKHCPTRLCIRLLRQSAAIVFS